MTNTNKKYTINPLTKRKIAINGKVYRSIFSGRRIVINGKTLKRLKNQNSLINTVVNVHCEGFNPLNPPTVEIIKQENGDTVINVYCNSEEETLPQIIEEKEEKEATPQIVEDVKYKKITTKSAPREEPKQENKADILRAEILAFQKTIRDKIKLNEEKAKITKEFIEKHYIEQYKEPTALFAIYIYQLDVTKYEWDITPPRERWILKNRINRETGEPIEATEGEKELLNLPRTNGKTKSMHGTKYIYFNNIWSVRVLIKHFKLKRFIKGTENKYIVRRIEEKDSEEFIERINRTYTGKYTRPYIESADERRSKTLDECYELNKAIDSIEQSQDVWVVIALKPSELPKGKKMTLPRLFQRQKINNTIMTDVVINKYIKYKINTKKEKLNILSDLFDVDASLCQYVQDNYKANSCFINEIINTYHDQFNKKRPDGTRYYKHALTYPYLCALLNIENKNQDLGLTVNESFKFFNHYGLGLDLINHIGERVLKYRPQNRKLNKDISPAVLRLMFHNNHVIQVNKEFISKVSHINITDKAEDIKALWINNKYNIRAITAENDEIKKENEYIHINNINDIMNYIKENPEKSTQFILNVDDDNNMNNLLHSLVYDHKFIPHVKMEKRDINGIYFDIDNNKYFIRPNINNITTAGAGTQIINPTKYNKYIKAEQVFYDSIIYKKIKSEYPADVLEIEERYKISPQGGYFTDEYPNYEIINAIDMVKAYSTCLRDIENVPVFGYFNRYRQYINGEKIDPLKMYIVDSGNEKHLENRDNVILFHKRVDRVYGYVLEEATKYNISYNIIYVRDYERIEPVEYKKALNKLYTDDPDDEDNKGKKDKIYLDNNEKKFIANKTCGLLEKKKNKRGISYVFNNYEEAEMYKYRYMENEIKAEIIQIEYEKEEETNKSKLYIDAPQTEKVTKILYILNLYKEKNLIDGFRQIKEMIYCNMRIKMYRLAQICKKYNMNVCGIRTDSLLLNNHDYEIENIPDINFNENEVGAYKIDRDKTSINKNLIVNIERLNYKIAIKTININNIDILDEYDTTEINNKINNNNRLIIKSIMPGSGKSQCIKNYHKDNHKVLFIVPNNELALEIKKQGFDAMTAHSFFGINHNEQNTHKKYISLIDYDTVCFEEVYQYKKSILKRVDMYINDHPNIKFVATGDNAQNKAIEDDDDADKDNDYIINMIFNNQINLKISKRLSNEADKQKLNKLKDQIFNLDLDISNIMKEHFNIIYNINYITTKQNITYSNATAQYLAEKIHNKTTYDTKKIIIDKKTTNDKKTIIQKKEYFLNMDLVCRKSIRTPDITLHTNYIYKLKDMTQDKNIILFEPVEKTEQTISQTQFNESMRLNYARTGYSIQGRTIGEKFTICDADSPYICRRWLWTAITRARDFKDITIYLMPEDRKDELHEYKLKLYFNILLKKFNKEKEFKLTADDVMEEIHRTPNCKKCKKEYYGNIKNGQVLSNVHININNNKINLCCTDCNKI